MTKASSLWAVVLLVLWLPGVSHADGPKIRVADVDLGSVDVGRRTHFTIDVLNIHDEAVEVRSLYLLDTTGARVTFDPVDLPIPIEVGGSLPVSATIVPTSGGTHHIRLVVQIDDDGDPDDTASCRVTVRGIESGSQGPTRLATSDTLVYVGDRCFIPIIAVGDSSWWSGTQIMSLRARVQYHRSVLTYDDTVRASFGNDSLRTVEIVRERHESGQVLAVLPFTACMGDRSVARVSISEITVVTSSGEINVDTTLVAQVSIQSRWPGGARYVTRDGDMPALVIFPNPSYGSVTLSVHGLVTGSRVEVYSIDGQLVYTWNHRSSTGGDDLHLQLGRSLTPGTYLCVVASNGKRVTRGFSVLR